MKLLYKFKNPFKLFRSFCFSKEKRVNENTSIKNRVEMN